MSYVAAAAVMGVGKFTLPLVFPLAFKYIVDVLLSSHPRIDGVNSIIDRWCSSGATLLGMDTSPHSKLAALSVALLVIYALQAVASYFRNYWAGIAGNRLILALQCRLFSHLQRLAHSFFDRNPAGAIVSRVLNDVAQANELVNSALIDVWMDVTSLSLVVVALFAMNWRLALVALGIAPLWVTFMRFFSPRIKAVSHRMQEKVEELNGEVHERVVGAATIKSFGREEDEVRQFSASSGQWYARSIDKVRLAAAQEMLIQVLTRSAPMVVVWVGASMIMRGTMTLGTLLAFFTYLGFLYLPLERLAQLSVVLSASLAAIERIFAFLDLKPEITDHPLARPFTPKRGAIDFEQVKFAYQVRDADCPREVLRGVDLHIPGGMRVALVGRSGAGKTTLANLIPRFYDATGGRVLIDGKDVRHMTLKSLRANVSLVTQEPLLFSSTIANNLLYARPDATPEMLWQALEFANLDGFIKQLPHQIDTVIGERGMKVSCGQRQRLALARAFLKDSMIVILDEATSSVDSEAENLIQDAIDRLMEGRTVVTIAHRLRSATAADIVVVLDQGSIAEIGPHAELLRRGGVYARLIKEQARGLMIDARPSEELRQEA
ncbi:MAG TPA: ABC transporter ATP-binding protein [Candidatus Binataceae bacterium]|nr:ABC transporter ATP-binding protein [Candidatus Binataceae bacterium]